MKHLKSVYFSACAMLIFCSPALSAQYPESSYYSLYQLPRTYDYTDLSGALKTQTRVGYQYQNDRTDSIVVCGKESDSSCVEAGYNTVYTLRASYAGKITTFKVYIPPGTTSVNLMTNVGQSAGSQYFTIARLGIPPRLDSTYVPTGTVYDNLPNNGFTLSELRTADCVGKNSSGYLYIARDSGLNIASESEGGWLYVIVKIIRGNITGNVYTNQVNTGTPSTPGTYLGWHADKTRNNTWSTLGEPSYIGTPTATPTPTPTGTTTPTPTPTPIPTTGCDPFACANTGGSCVSNVCVISTPTPVPSATPTPNSCDALLCALSLGTCVNGKCVPNSTTPTPTPTPSPTTIPIPVSFSFTPKPASEVLVESIPCTNIALTNIVPVLASNSPPAGDMTYYSALLFPGVTPSYFIAQKDILGNSAFILFSDGDSIKGRKEEADPVDGSWKDESFKLLFTSLLSRYPGITCASIAESGVSFLFGYAPNGDISQFQGAAFTFVK